MIFTGVLTAASILVIFAKLGKPTLKKILGYEIHMDVASHVFFVGLGAISGTFSGVVQGLVAALCVAGVLRLAKRVIGYSTRENGVWVDHPGTWTFESLTVSIVSSVKDLINKITAGVVAGLNQINGEKPEVVAEPVVH